MVSLRAERSDRRARPSGARRLTTWHDGLPKETQERAGASASSVRLLWGAGWYRSAQRRSPLAQPAQVGHADRRDGRPATPHARVPLFLDQHCNIGNMAAANRGRTTCPSGMPDQPTRGATRRSLTSPPWCAPPILRMAFCVALRQSDIASNLIGDRVNRIGDRPSATPSQPPVQDAGFVCRYLRHAARYPAAYQPPERPGATVHPPARTVATAAPEKQRSTARGNANFSHQRRQPSAVDVALPPETRRSRPEMPALRSQAITIRATLK